MKHQRASVCSTVSVIQMDAEIDQQSFINCCDQSNDLAQSRNNWFNRTLQPKPGAGQKDWGVRPPLLKERRYTTRKEHLSLDADEGGMIRGIKLKEFPRQSWAGGAPEQLDYYLQQQEQLRIHQHLTDHSLRIPRAATDTNTATAGARSPTSTVQNEVQHLPFSTLSPVSGLVRLNELPSIGVVGKGVG